MTRLVSGRVLKTPSANVSAERYQFIEISEVEPDLGLPPANGYVFTSDTDGVRSWIQLSTDNVVEGSNLYYTDDRAHANLKLSSIGDLFDVTTANIEIAQALVWDGNLFVPVFVNSEVGNVADLAVRVLNLENFTTANIAEASSNLYFTNSRVIDALVGSDVVLNDLFIAGDLVVQGNSAILNVATLIVEDKNIVLANGAADASIADGAGITIQGADANITYRESGDKFEINKNLDIQGNIIAGTGDGGSITGAQLISANTLVISDSATVNGYEVLTKELTDATFEPMGHEDKANSTISFDDGTRTFTIQPTGDSYTVWVKGNKFVKTGSESVTLDDATDLYYIYFNTAGNLAVRSSYFDWENDAVTSYVYYNANTSSAVFFADERHGIALDWATHEYLHRTRGAVIAEGFSIGNYTTSGDGSSDTHAQLDIGNGTFFDEDLEVNITHSNSPTADTWEQDLQGPARIPMFYLSGTEWVRDNPTDFPLKQGTSRIKYNLLSGGQWTTPDVPTDGLFTTTWIIATNNLNYPILAIMGQSANDTLGEEEAINFQDLTLTNFPVIEFRPLYKVIWSTDTGYSNTPKAIIRRVYDLRNIISASPTAAIASDHGLLSGLGDDDHSQYVHTEVARTISADHTFTGDVSFSNLIVSGAVSGNLNGIATTVSTLDNFTTDNLKEGAANLYYTNTRVISAVTPLLTTANVTELDNLYYTNARVLANVSEMSINVLSDVDITSIALGQILSWDGNKFIPGSADIALFSEFANSALFANVVGSLEGLTTDDLEEGSNNLYFTSRRAIDSLTAGKGIIITEAGTISSVDDSDLYNIAIDNSVYDIVTTEGKSVIAIDSTPTDASYLVHSLQLTNISDNEVYISGNIQFASGQNVDLLNRLRMPVGSSLEILEKSLILLPGDIINLTTFDGNVSVAGTYESVFDDESFINPSLTIAAADADELVYNSNLSYAIIETIKVVNLDNVNIPVKIIVADANNNPKGYLIYNLDIPENSIVDVLQKPKRLENGDKLFASYTGSANSNAVSIFVSGRLGAVSGIEIVPAAIDGTPGNTVIAFATTEAEGTTLYYTFTEV